MNLPSTVSVWNGISVHEAELYGAQIERLEFAAMRE
jgi:hypothetical protein